jgi:hypothetical protein
MRAFLRRLVLCTRIPFGLIATVGLLLTSFVHVASVKGTDIEYAWPHVWAQHYVLFPIVVLAVLTAAIIAEQKERLGFRDFLALVPVPVLILLAAALVYTLATILIFTPLSSAGEPLIENGRYYFNNHGVVYEVTETQLHFQRSVSLRLFSAVWLYLYLFSDAFLLGAKRMSLSRSAISVTCWAKASAVLAASPSPSQRSLSLSSSGRACRLVTFSARQGRSA